jgi:predicted GH43/DUF377 family glycosyl hydrolase
MKPSFIGSLILLGLSTANVFAAGDPPKVPKRQYLHWHINYDIEKPGNQSANRFKGYKDAQEFPPEYPPTLERGATLKNEGIILGPSGKYHAMFNPGGPWTAVDPVDGIEKVFMVVRAEQDVINKETGKKMKVSYGELLASDDARRFYRYTKKPWLKPTEAYEEATEDARYADLRLQPFVDTDGKIFDAAMMYTAYDGKTARISVMFFNHDKPLETRKKGLVFNDLDVMKDPFVPGNPAWNKSMAMRQVKDEVTGKVTNHYFFGEGNMHHGGIKYMASDHPFSSAADGAFGLDFKKANIALTGREGFFDQGLVEAAFQPEVVALSDELAKATGHKEALMLAYHGDSPPWGYSVGYALFPLDDPSRGPIFRSKGPYKKPIEEFEKSVQVDKVIFGSAGFFFHGERLEYSGVGDQYIVLHSGNGAPPIVIGRYKTYNPCMLVFNQKLPR